MSKPAIKIQNLSKQYRLGTVGTGTLSHDLKRWWTMNIQGKDDPNLRIGELNDRSVKANSDYVWALKDINLEIKQGDIVGIIGKNGAGKSTLLKILSRVTSPTTGSVEYSGRMASLLEVGTGFHAEMTGRENIFMNGSIMGMTKVEIKRKLDEIIDFAGIEKYIDTPVKRYSSGMTVRLGFSIAAHLEPEILIVDEVLAVGDAEFQKKAIGKMQDVSKGEGRTVLFVSHNMAAVKTLCKNGLVLVNGQVSFVGDISNSIDKYRNSLLSTLDVSKNSNGVYDLTQKNNLIDDNYKCMEKVSLFCDNKPSNLFYGGCNFRFEILASNKLKYENLLYGFVVKNSDGMELIGINNRHTANNFCIEKDEQVRFITEIKEFPIFKEGVYSVDLYWGNFDTSFEILRDAFYFEIEKTDVYNTGCIIESSLNLVYVKDVFFDLKKL